MLLAAWAPLPECPLLWTSPLSFRFVGRNPIHNATVFLQVEPLDLVKSESGALMRKLISTEKRREQTFFPLLSFEDITFVHL